QVPRLAGGDEVVADGFEDRIWAAETARGADRDDGRVGDEAAHVCQSDDPGPLHAPRYEPACVILDRSKDYASTAGLSSPRRCLPAGAPGQRLVCAASSAPATLLSERSDRDADQETGPRGHLCPGLRGHARLLYAGGRAADRRRSPERGLHDLQPGPRAPRARYLPLRVTRATHVRPADLVQ